VLRDRFAGGAQGIALAAAAIWLVHPLQTESVTYISQRAESLMGLCYLLTLYFFIRGIEPGRAPPGFGFSAVACLLGMASKEVMASAPLLVLLYDHTSWREISARPGAAENGFTRPGGHVGAAGAAGRFDGQPRGKPRDSGAMSRRGPTP